MDLAKRAARRRRWSFELGGPTMEPVFLGMVFVIMWLSGSLFAADIAQLQAAERRILRCPSSIR